MYDILHDEGSGYGITADTENKNNGCYIGWVQYPPGPNMWFDYSIDATASGIFTRGEGESCEFMGHELGFYHEYCAGDLGCCDGKCEVLVDFVGRAVCVAVAVSATVTDVITNVGDAVTAVGDVVGDAVTESIDAVGDAATDVGDTVTEFADSLFGGW